MWKGEGKIKQDDSSLPYLRPFYEKKNHISTGSNHVSLNLTSLDRRGLEHEVGVGRGEGFELIV